MSLDMYGDKVAAAAELIRKLTGGTEWFSAFDRSTEDTLELFVAAMDVVREEEREKAKAQLPMCRACWKFCSVAPT